MVQSTPKNKGNINVKKCIKVVALVLVACMSFLLAGCDLFGKNYAQYYGQNVITISYGDNSKIEISRRDFLTAYNNYGQNLISNGYTESQAQEATVQALVNRQIMLKEAKRVSTTAEGMSIALTSIDIKNLYYQTYEAMLSNARDYEDDIRSDWNKPKEESMAQETTTDAVKYTPYTKQAEPVYDSTTKSFRIKLIEENEDESYSIDFADLDAVYNSFVEMTKNNQLDSIAREEYRRYLASLQSSQKVLGTNYTEQELIKNEIKRIYDNLEENEYITKYQEYKQDNDGYSTITVNQVLEKYKSMISVSKFKYENNTSSYDSDMLSNRENVNYFINDDYFYVAHILIKFNETQQAKYEELETLSNNGKGDIISAQNYELQKKELYSSVKAQVRNTETGEIEEQDAVSASKVLTEVKNALAGKSDKQKDEAFRDLMYKYNEDDGIMNAIYPYVIGEKEDQSKMVENFTNASRELNAAGVYGGVSELVESEYGLHIIYYMGKCENPFTFNSDNTLNLRAYYEEDGKPNSDIMVLDNTKLNNLNNKTVFDLVYEQLSNDNYSQFENMNLSTLKKTNNIEIDVLDKLI